ncbi:hypothetical protein [Quatrionicoccus australiensis]|uniref:hypothetical protein n=1 Tax=Quatrionicoccus australiensis TaxID=138118 RepID=UPI001CFBDC40|nr:hypothetical protein [Quatrionicoccus australiensis]MCB4361877.1 hypothetical protein [Quatrionicoccus australiensis]
MNKLNLSMLALALGLAFSTGASAENMNKADYSAAKDKIGAEYKNAKAACSSMSGNAGDICDAEAKGKEKVGMADLDAAYKPSAKTQHEARVVKAEADYAVAKERCDDKAGNVKDVCVKEAKATETAAKADAKAAMKTSDANATANEKTSDARKDASADKTDANYAVAKEKCDAMAGNAKDRCIDQAKLKYGK